MPRLMLETVIPTIHVSIYESITKQKLPIWEACYVLTSHDDECSNHKSLRPRFQNDSMDFLRFLNGIRHGSELSKFLL
jgi:hypothetical protein